MLSINNKRKKKQQTSVNLETHIAQQQTTFFIKIKEKPRQQEQNNQNLLATDLQLKSYWHHSLF